MAKVYSQLIIELEHDAQTISGARLDLQGLSSMTRVHLDEISARNPNIRILSVYSPTKDWQIGAQISLGAPFEKDSIT